MFALIHTSQEAEEFLAQVVQHLHTQGYIITGCIDIIPPDSPISEVCPNCSLRKLTNRQCPQCARIRQQQPDQAQPLTILPEQHAQAIITQRPGADTSAPMCPTCGCCGQRIGACYYCPDCGTSIGGCS